MCFTIGSMESRHEICFESNGKQSGALRLVVLAGRSVEGADMFFCRFVSLVIAKRNMLGNSRSKDKQR